MIDQKSNRKASSRPETTENRRAFLVKSAVGGVGASLAVCGGAAPARAEYSAGPCELQASALDALTLLKDSVNDLQSAVYKQSFTAVSDAFRKVSDYFGELCGKIGELKAALIAERKGAAYERMKALADIGCTSAGQVKEMSSVGKAQQQLSSLNTIGEQIRAIAYELLPEGQGVTLSVEATRILREIILIIDGQAEQQRQLRASVDQSRRSVGELDEAVQSIQRHLSDAAIKIAEPDSAAETARLVEKARDELKALQARLQADASVAAAAQKAKLLTALAEGTRLWVAGDRPALADAGGRALFRPAVYRREPAAPAMAAALAEIGSLIYNLYPPEGFWKEGRCKVLVGQLLLWAKAGFVSRENAAEMVERGLANYHLSCSDYQGRGCQRDRFVQELVRIILG